MTRILTCLLLLVAAIPDQSQSGPGSRIAVIVIRDHTGALKGYFQPRPQPYQPRLALPLQTALGRDSSVRAKDGLVVNGFGFYGWEEGPVIHLHVFELVPAAGLENKYWWTPENPDPRGTLQARELAQYKLAHDQTQVIEEMKALGVAPMRASVQSGVPSK